MTFTDASNYVFSRLSHDADGSLLTITLRRLAIICANLPGALAWLELFEREFRLERGRLRLQTALSVAKRIDECRST